MTLKRRPKFFLALIVGFALAATACSTDNHSADILTVYSGRSEELIAPLLDAFTAATGVKVDVRFGDSAELALLIQTEGDNSPADLFISQSPGALGLLAGEGRLAKLDASIAALVDARFAAHDGTWVGLTGRVRVVVYNSELVDEADLPRSVLDLTEAAYAGRVGVAPANGSFQDFVTAMRNELGDEATLGWLKGMAENGSPSYPKNSAIVEAVGRGEVDMGLVNHYYNLRAIEADPSVTSVNHFLEAGDIGSLVIVTGGAVLASSDAAATGEDLLRYLLSTATQAEFVAETREYPLRAGVRAPAGVPSLDGLAVDTINYDLLGDGLTGTIDLIRESGLEQ